MYSLKHGLNETSICCSFGGSISAAAISFFSWILILSVSKFQTTASFLHSSLLWFHPTWWNIPGAWTALQSDLSFAFIPDFLLRCLMGIWNLMTKTEFYFPSLLLCNFISRPKLWLFSIIPWNWSITKFCWLYLPNIIWFWPLLIICIAITTPGQAIISFLHYC